MGHSWQCTCPASGSPRTVVEERAEVLRVKGLLTLMKHAIRILYRKRLCTKTKTSYRLLNKKRAVVHPNPALAVRLYNTIN
jgi:hypothetical protein